MIVIIYENEDKSLSVMTTVEALTVHSDVSQYISNQRYVLIESSEISDIDACVFDDDLNIIVDADRAAILKRQQLSSLTRRQFKLALLENGLLSTVEQIIESIEDPTVKARIQIEYSESERFERTNDSVKYMLGVLNLTSDKVDEMWRYAMTL
ncbi:hypothetical protein N5D11_16195 [Acinetobacter johnsonii]|uniref:Uncharacterized protein n=1 Tax=Acinetobacter johnsonii TaxID=40214 RepID=A0AA42LBS6_ACIJO|nr:hypothetical protein [Acinetobacter johnsonii]MDH0657626.1 hypothetical protein [Acinetobacter johnsonii]